MFIKLGLENGHMEGRKRVSMGVRGLFLNGGRSGACLKLITITNKLLGTFHKLIAHFRSGVIPIISRHTQVLYSDGGASGRRTVSQQL